MSSFWNFAKCDATLLFLFSRQLTDLHTNQLTGQHILQLSVKRYTYSFCHAMIVCEANDNGVKISKFTDEIHL